MVVNWKDFQNDIFNFLNQQVLYQWFLSWWVMTHQEKNKRPFSLYVSGTEMGAWQHHSDSGIITTKQHFNIPGDCWSLHKVSGDWQLPLEALAWQSLSLIAVSCKPPGPSFFVQMRSILLASFPKMDLNVI